MEHLAVQAFAILAGVPLLLVFVAAAAWVGAESMGVGWPIEPMMLFAGSAAAMQRPAGGWLSLGAPGLAAVAILLMSAACLGFASLAYLVGRRIGTGPIVRVGHFVGLDAARVDHIEHWLQHRGTSAVFLARLTPMVRTYSSYVMGAARLPYRVFAPATLAGAIVYCGVWTVVGALLGDDYRAPLRYLDHYGDIGVAAVVLVVAVVVLIHHLWGRLMLRRLARLFHLHHHQHAGVAQAAKV